MGKREEGRRVTEGRREERKEGRKEGGKEGRREGRVDHIHLMDSNSIHYFHNLAGT